MSDQGLTEVNNPSEMFLSQRKEDISGSTVVCVMEGTRSILLEIQALVTPSNYGLPQRTATGVDAKRLAILLAVLERRAGLRIGTHDVFVNAVGGVRIDETAADLGIIMSIASSLKNQIINPRTAVIGEVGLGGEIRSVSQIEKRLSEMEKLGFEQALIPASNKKTSVRLNKLKVTPVDKLSQAIEFLLA
jgi:DNA repair protein RadA/Sms